MTPNRIAGNSLKAWGIDVVGSIRAADPALEWNFWDQPQPFRSWSRTLASQAADFACPVAFVCAFGLLGLALD